MDQAKVYLAIAKKHHFWILISIVVITALVVWLKASSSLANKYETDKKTITTAEESVQKSTNPEPVNKLFADKVDKLHDGLKTAVFDAWKKLYDRQVLWFRWPDFSEYDANIDLGKFGPDEDIPKFVRDIYNEKLVREQWEDLFEKANLRKLKPKKDRTDPDYDPEQETRGVEYEGLVVWAPDKREAISNRYYTVNSTPSSARIRLAQEDYWLFESLIEVINNVNKGAGDTLKAPIKEIKVMDVAQWAIAASVEDGGAIWTKEKAAGAMGGGAMGGGAMGGGAMGGGAIGGPIGLGGAAMSADAMAGADANAGLGQAATSTKSAEEDDKTWLENRYLDDKGQPLGASATQPFAEFKQVFVYLKLVMDQRRIPDLIAACANAHLPIETRQIRVRMLSGGDSGGLFPGGAGGMFTGGPMGGSMDPMGIAGGGMMGADPMAGGGYPPGYPGAGGASGGYPPGYPGASGAGSGGYPPGYPGAGGASGGYPPGYPGASGAGGYDGASGGVSFGGGMIGQEGGVETTDYDWLVELSGVIYLYNPANLEKLGSGAVGAPEKRSFGVPTKPVRPPRSGSSNGGYMGSMMGPMGP